MADNNGNKGGTIYQNLNKFLNIDTIGGNSNLTTGVNASPNSQSRKIIIKGNTPEEIYRKGLELEQKQKLQDKFFRTSDRGFQKAMQYEAARLPAYIDYEGMEFYPLIASALDLFMEEATTIGTTGKMLNIYSNKERIKLTLEDFFYNIVNVNTNLPFWTRNLTKYGDNFVGIYGERKKGITSVRQLVNYEIERFERVQDGKMSIKFKERMTGDEFNTFEMAHFRLLGDDKMIPYGSSSLNKVRRVFRQLVLAEDAMLTYRLIRAGEKKVFKIDVGNIDEDDVEEYMYKVSEKFKRTPQIDNNNGQIDYRFNVMGVDEDYFIPVRNANVQTGIDTLPGACLSLDTKIELLDGRSLELNNIISEYESGEQLWSYSINPKTGEIVPAKITWAGVTRKDTQVLKITLDNGESITCTPDHKFNTRVGDIKEAKDLTIGESLWSFNKRFKQIKNSRNEYEQIYDHNLKKWVYTHRMVSNNINLEEFIFDIKNYGFGKCNVIHHKDFNRFNNSPNNLVVMDDLDHFKYHGTFSKVGSDAYKEKYNTDNEFKLNTDERLLKGRNTYHNKLKNNLDFKKGVILKQSISAKNYINNLNNYDRNERDIRSYNNSTKGRKTFLERYNSDENFKRDVIAKARKSSILTKNKPENRLIYANNTKNLWLNNEFRKIIVEAQTIKYSELLLNIVIKLIKEYKEVTKILDIINDKNGEFYNEFFTLNDGNKQLESKFNKFTSNSICKLIKHFNYKNIKELNKEISLYNHSIISIEYLSEKQDTGTITIDGNEEFHDFHNFALTCGIFTKNSNLNDINDISYLRDNLFIGLGIPKPFLSFQDASGGGKNIAQFDIRFSKKVNRIQQAMIQELNKMAMIHLYYLGFEAEDLNNFTLSLTNPSTQQELLKIELMQAKAQVYGDMTRAEAGIAAMSHTNAKRQILNMSDSDIVEDLRQQKMEKVIMQEFADSPVVIKKTGLFADIDKKYGADSENMTQSGTTSSAAGGGMSGGGSAPMDDDGMPPMDNEPPIEGEIPPNGGEEGETPAPIAGLPNQSPSDLPPIKEGMRREMDETTYNKYVNKLVYGVNDKENTIKLETNQLIMETESNVLDLNSKALNLINEIENMVSRDNKKYITEDDSDINLNELNLDEDF